MTTQTKALFRIEPLLKRIKAGAVVLTPNNRLRNHIRQAFFEASNESVVATPAVFSLNEWINNQWTSLIAGGDESCLKVVLNELQATTLWREVLNQTNNDSLVDLTQLSKLIQQLREAQRFLILWDIPVNELINSPFAFGEAAHLHHWLKEYDKLLRLREAQLPEQRWLSLQRAYEAGKLGKQDSIILYSFDDLAPIIKNTLTKAANTIEEESAKDYQPTTTYRVACADRESEFHAAAQWAQNILDTDTTARVGIVVPTLGTDRDTVEHVFARHFTPQQLNIDTPRSALPYNISAGTPLGNAPVIYDALLLLSLALGNLTLDEWQQLFHSPFFGHWEEETEIRAAICNIIKQQEKFIVKPGFVRERLQGSVQSQAEIDFAKRFTAAATLERDERKPFQQKQSASDWIAFILQYLETLHWPGSRELDSVEYQQVSQWHNLLETFASIDWLQAPMTFSQALTQIRQLANNTHFQSEVKNSPLYILGTLEAAGLHFTHCWITGLDNRNWPPRPNPNSLIPIQLQRHYQLPRASAERELNYAITLTNQLLHSADHLRVSHATTEDESPLLPSPLIEHIELADSSLLSSALDGDFVQQHYTQLRTQHNLEWVNCEFGPSINEPSSIAGGVRAIEQQILCPFNSFAVNRLHANRIDDPVLGLTRRQKGDVLHRAMENIWEGIQTQEKLLTLSSNDLSLLINNELDRLIHWQLQSDLSALGEFYYQYEKKHLHDIILSSLLVDKTRSPFHIVSQEEKLAAQLGDITLSLRIDRIDQLESGETVIIDYKSSKQIVSNLLPEKLYQPQLALYAIAYQPTPSAVAFFPLLKDTPGLQGVGDINEEVKGIKTVEKALKISTWHDLVISWRETLTAVGEDYCRGNTTLQAMTNLPTYMEYLHPLNRLQEQEFLRFSYLDESEAST